MTERSTPSEPDPTAHPDRTSHPDPTAAPASDRQPTAGHGDIEDPVERAHPSTDPAEAADPLPATNPTAAADPSAGPGAAAPDVTPGEMPPETAEIPHEPSKYELAADQPATAAPAPPLETGDPDAAPIQPKRAAVVSLGLLAVVMLVLGVLALQQDARTIYQSYNPAQVQAVAALLEDADIRTYSEDEVTAVEEVWATEDHPNPTNEEIADAFNQATNSSGEEAITASDVEQVLSDAGGSLELPSEQSIADNLRTQVMIYFGAFALAAISGYFYFRGKSWARVLGMFVSGVVAIMWGMQALQSGFIPLLLIIAVVGAVAFYFLMKGRLQPVGTPVGGLGQLFAPRRSRRPGPGDGG